ncbi:MAG: GNAT family acetyltransferase [Endozoicomonas sp.]|uniref:GNAT family acetyltransferase n=1 Tax=Endozoicomonas sp. TaxID=1892382 RepID=UPI003D9B09A4
MKIRPFEINDETAVIQLWKECGLTVPWNDPQLDIQRKLAVGRDLFLVGTLENKVIASAMGGYEGHRGWVNYLAVDPEVQNHGFGARLMEHLESLLIAKGCPKINLQVRSSNVGVIEFYQSLGYGVDDTVSLGKRLIADE